jgi:hypothetical protein
MFEPANNLSASFVDSCSDWTHSFKYNILLCFSSFFPPLQFICLLLLRSDQTIKSRRFSDFLENPNFLYFFLIPQKENTVKYS